MQRIAAATLAVALVSLFGHAEPAAAGARCGAHRHFVRGHIQRFHGHPRFVKGYCAAN